MNLSIQVRHGGTVKGTPPLIDMGIVTLTATKPAHRGADTDTEPPISGALQENPHKTRRPQRHYTIYDALFAASEDLKTGRGTYKHGWVEDTVTRPRGGK